MAEGARFELADPLRGLRFSRPARSAAPSPLQTKFAQPGGLHITLADGRNTTQCFFLIMLARPGAYQSLVDSRVVYRRIVAILETLHLPGDWISTISVLLFLDPFNASHILP